jgi:chromosome segregation ATPase
MSERETPIWHWSAAGMSPAKDWHAVTLYVRKRDADAENARLKDELERTERGWNYAEARVTELEAKLADVSEHAEYEQRRADGAVAELVEVHAKLAEAERKYLDAWRESQVERGLAVRAEQALAEALCGRQLL